MIHIVIHNSKKEDTDNDFIYLYNIWKRIYRQELKSQSDKTRIVIYNVVIVDFKHGSLENCRGYRPDYYITDDTEISRYLDATGGKYIGNLGDMMKVCNDYIFKKLFC